MKINQLSFRTTIFALVAMLIMSACSSAPAAAPTPNLPPIRIGINPWIGFGPLYIAEAKGFFAKEGVTVDMVNLASANAGNSSFASKQVDANTTTLSDTVAQAAAQVPVQVVWIFDTSVGADVFIGTSAIKTPADLKGKRVGLSYGTFGHVFVLSGLAKLGISRDDISVIDVAGEDVPQAMADGKIDAGHTWEPHLSQALKNGAHVIFTSSDTPGIIDDILEFQTSVLQKRPNEVQAIFRALQDGSDYWASNPDDANQIVAKALGDTVDNLPNDLKGVHLYTLAENQALFDPSSPQSVHPTVKTISDFFIKEKVVAQAPTAQTLLNGTFALALSTKK